MALATSSSSPSTVLLSLPHSRRPSGVRFHSTKVALETEGESSSQACERVTKVGAVANIGLCVLKAAGGAASGSSAMLADAFHSLGDLVSDAVTLASLRYSRESPSEAFPFGKGKVESLGALSVALLLVGTAGGIAQMSLVAISAPMGVPVITGSAALVCAGISVVVKELLYHATVSVGRRARSQVTVANAHHHRSDALSSVVALGGIAGNMSGIAWLDPVGGIVVAGMIFKTGCEIGWDALCVLTDKSADIDEGLLEAIHTACADNNVKIPGKMQCRQMGPFLSLYLTLHVKSTLSVSAASQLSLKIKTSIMTQREEVQSCFITVLPLGEGGGSMVPHDRLKTEVLAVIDQRCPLIHSVTHFTPHYLSGNVTVNLEVTMDPMAVTTIKEAAAVARAAERSIKEDIPSIKHVDVHLELRGLSKNCEVFERLPEEDKEAKAREATEAMAGA